METFLEFAKLLKTEQTTIEFLQEKGILRRDPPNCGRENCGRKMSFVKSKCVHDEYVWRCPSHKGSKLSVREKSYLSGQKIRLRQFCLLAYTWALGIPSHTQKIFTDLSGITIIHWNKYLREVCSRWLVKNPLKLGGPDKIVEIEDYNITKRKSRHKNTKHKQIDSGKWAFCIYDIEKKIGWIETIEKQDHETFLSIIERIVVPGSIIYSRCSEKYRGIEDIPVAPSYIQNFVDQGTGTSTSLNHVRAFWGRAMAKIRTMHGTPSDHLSGYFNEFMWRQLNGGCTVETFDKLLQQISEFYSL